MRQTKPTITATLELRPADTIPHSPTLWAIPHRLPCHHLSAIVAPTGAGLTTLAVNLCAHLAPIENRNSQIENNLPAVLLLPGRESIYSTRERLAAAGADLSRILILDEVEETISDNQRRDTHRRAPDASDHNRIASVLREHKSIRLVLIDNAEDLFTTSNRPSRNKLLRQLTAFQDLAESREVAVTFLTAIPSLSRDPFRTRFLSALQDVCRTIHLLAPEAEISDPSPSIANRNSQIENPRLLFLPQKHPHPLPQPHPPPRPHQALRRPGHHHPRHDLPGLRLPPQPPQTARPRPRLPQLRHRGPPRAPQARPASPRRPARRPRQGNHPLPHPRSRPLLRHRPPRQGTTRHRRHPRPKALVLALPRPGNHRAHPSAEPTQRTTPRNLQFFPKIRRFRRPRSTRKRPSHHPRDNSARSHAPTAAHPRASPIRNPRSGLKNAPQPACCLGHNQNSKIKIQKSIYSPTLTMKQHTLSSRAISLDDSWDVIVAGGGPAGCTAAAAAAREGAKTLLIEATGALGGMGTAGLVPAWCPFSDKKQIIYRGLAEKVFAACKKGMPHVAPDELDWVAIDPELLKRIYDDLVTGAGAKILFNTTLAAVESASGSVSALIVANKSGLTALKAKIYIDCTGDADLAAWAGAEFHKGGDAGDLQPATHCFVLSNVDDYAYRTGPWMHGANPNSPIHAVLKSGKYPRIIDSHMCQKTIGPGSVGFNAGHLYKVDNTDPWNVSSALVEGRKLAADFRNALAEFHPSAFGNSFLSSTGSLIGIRETRRIVGDYVLTFEDYFARRSFEDEICRNSYYIDVHAKRDSHEQIEKETHRYGPGESHGVPYRCLTPKGLKNVLVAGRAVSCDRPVQGSVRVMPVCLAMGEAAGIAASMAGKGGDVHAVSVPDLRARLREMGAYLP